MIGCDRRLNNLDDRIRSLLKETVRSDTIVILIIWTIGNNGLVGS